MTDCIRLFVTYVKDFQMFSVFKILFTLLTCNNLHCYGSFYPPNVDFMMQQGMSSLSPSTIFYGCVDKVARLATETSERVIKTVQVKSVHIHLFHWLCITNYLLIKNVFRIKYTRCNVLSVSFCYYWLVAFLSHELGVKFGPCRLHIYRICNISY
jgi:hypothetical protein